MEPSPRERALARQRIPPDLARGLVLLSILWVGGVLIWAGVGKLRDPTLFRDQVANYELLPESLVAGFSRILPLAEILCGLGLFLPMTRRWARWACVGLAMLFLLALLTAWIRGLEIPCGCFGRRDAPTHFPTAILFDLGLLVPLLTLGWLWKRRDF